MKPSIVMLIINSGGHHQVFSMECEVPDVLEPGDIEKTIFVIPSLREDKLVEKVLVPAVQETRP